MITFVSFNFRCHLLLFVGNNIMYMYLPEITLMLNFKKDWDILAESVKPRVAEIEEKEIQGIKIFLKQLANEYYDMELLSKGIIDSTKKESAKSIAKEFIKNIRDCDDAASNGNIAKLVETYPTTATELKDFFALLQDVPDEI